MSRTENQKEEEEEFEDALGEAAASFKDLKVEAKDTNEDPNDLVEKVLKEQEDLETKEKSGENEDNKDQEDEEVDIYDEEELRDLEKFMSAEELLQNKETADSLKSEGNDLFKSGEYERSITVYNEALRLCPTTYNKERAILYGNRAAAKIQLQSKKSAIADCSQAIELWPDYVRAILRRAKLYEGQDDLESALKDFKRVYDLDPSQPDAREAVVRLPPIVNERQERMKEEVMSKLKDLGNIILKPFGLSTNNFKMQQDPNSGSYSINFKQN